MSKIKNIIFDLGGVLIDWSPRRLYEKIFHSDAAIDFFLQNVTTADWNEQQDAGRSIKEANLELCTLYPEYTPEITAFYDRWEEEMLGGTIPGMESILEQCLALHTIDKVVALTNWSAETFPHARQKFGFLDKFHGILVSGDEMMKKPDPRIYHLLLERYDLVAEESLFIDDSLRNVKAARECGIPSIHFKSAQQLKKEVEKYRIQLAL